MKDKEVMVYHCPFKGCVSGKEWFADAKSLLKHIGDTHSEEEIEKRLRTKKKAINISPASHSNGLNTPHMICVMVNDRLHEEVHVDDIDVHNTENEAVLSKCESVINIGKTFGLSFVSQIHTSNSSTTLTFKK